MTKTLKDQVREIVLLDRVRKQMESLRRTLISARVEERESNLSFPVDLESAIEDLNDRIYCLERCSRALEDSMSNKFLPKG